MSVVDGRWHLDLDQLRKVIMRERPKMLMLCHPHNPTGRAFSLDELTAIASLCAEFDVLVVSDEIHADLLYQPLAHIPFASLSPEAAARTITITAASKSFNLAGLRCAVMAFGSLALRERFDRVFSSHILGVPSVMGMLASMVAWGEGVQWLDDCVTYLDGNRRYTFDRMLALGLAGSERAPMSEATYLQWLDFSGVPGVKALLAADADLNVSILLREQGKVALNEGPTFGTGLAQCARLNFGTSRSVLTEACNRIESWVSRQS
jgi:cysteine-S-conjugate beta-lyase